jgi:hypothetical protein
VLGEVAHPLQVRRDVQGGEEQPQVGGDRCLAGQELVDPLLDPAVVLVDRGVPGDHLLRQLAVDGEQGHGRLAHRVVDGVGHRHQDAADVRELSVVLRAHPYQLRRQLVNAGVVLGELSPT